MSDWIVLPSMKSGQVELLQALRSRAIEAHQGRKCGDAALGFAAMFD